MKPFERIYAVVSLIPKGKVLTYKEIAQIAKIRDIRLVGFALHQNKTPKAIPCHRVVKDDGSLAAGYAFGGKIEQIKKLKKEGVVFEKDKVDLEKSLLLWGKTKS